MTKIFLWKASPSWIAEEKQTFLQPDQLNLKKNSQQQIFHLINETIQLESPAAVEKVLLSENAARTSVAQLAAQKEN